LSNFFVINLKIKAKFSTYCLIAKRFTIWPYNFAHIRWLKAKSAAAADCLQELTAAGSSK
jgi:hypothetical protein